MDIFTIITIVPTIVTFLLIFFNVKGRKKVSIKKFVLILSISCIPALGLFFLYNNFFQSGEERIQENTYSEEHKEDITDIIEQVEILADKGEYEEALIRIENALAIYPESVVLQRMKTEYRDALAWQNMGNVLIEADHYAKSGDYESAMSIIANAQIIYGDSEEYKAAYDFYLAEYKKKVIAVVDALANNGDYAGAIQRANAADAIIDDDLELRKKVQEYEDLYVLECIEQADELLLAGKYDSADSLIMGLLIQFPENLLLKAESEKIDNLRPIYLLDEIKPYITPPWYIDNTMFSMGGQIYSHGFTCMGYGDSPVGNQTFFNLEGLYSEMSFTAGIIEDRGRTVNFSFYADGKLIYDFSMKSGDLPVEHTMNVEECKQLVIAVYDGKWVADGSGTYGLADIKVTRVSSSNAAVITQNSLDDGEVYLLSTVEPYLSPFWYDDDAIIENTKPPAMLGRIE